MTCFVCCALIQDCTFSNAETSRQPRRYSAHGDRLQAKYSKKPELDALARAISCTQLQPPVRAKSSPPQAAPRFHIAYTDDAVNANSVANMYRLVRAAQDDQNLDDNSVAFAKKALRYRKLLGRAKRVDVEDPLFDMAAFMRVRWSKNCEDE